MGCATSKQRPVCRNCRGPCAPMTRSYSMHVHHPPQSDGDSYHVVALKSTTLGSLQLDPSYSNEVRGVKNPGVVHIRPEPVRQNEIHKESKEFAVGVIDAKTWSKMIEEKIPKFVPRTPITTPPGEPETINAWELMEGLDDTSPLRPKSTANHIRSFSFHVNPSSFSSHLDEPATEFPEKDRQTEISGKPLCLPIAENNSDSNSLFDSNDTSVASDFDTEVITSFRKSLELLPPANPFHLKPLIDEKEPPSSDGYCGESLDITNSKVSLNGFFSDGKNISPPRVQEKLVLYFTSLRGVRKTYEDCCHVRHILKATGVRVDERDVSMHSGFKEELKELLGGFIGGGLPKVFIGNKCIGGAAEIRRLHEDGQLEKALEGCEMVDGGGYGGAVGGGGGGGGGCEACGDIRFLPCETCSGSCKIYYEDESDEVDDDEKEESDYGFQRCPDCNENGLIRCPICCD
ncbi:hypothetical protein L2E82_33431 [Cichorium intybus]|uniref:Uncharacterized protein n=1 Tax=Cichorium intybus TaxID=13427 RepID=A0ACB9BKD6_CICIN|nr:hypothetical protein L2E82_33431 [Cichorium intybus]